ncbi:MAG: class I SAM-dependent methyltransferase [Burkholderiaceae bacterium]|jgi:SAM-dependent methyltransferase|nr:class I SAM-dependent methyltransferase [Burkholderiaceae bacterium]
MIDLHDWFKTPPGQHVLAWERARLDAALADVFGYHALQLGLPGIDALAANRMPYRWLATSVPPAAQPAAATPRAALAADPAALPFAEASLDLVALPHTLDLSANPHAALREVRRVLVHEGKVAITGFNPVRLWDFRRWRAPPSLPAGSAPIGPYRLRDWLRLLEFEIESIHFGGSHAAARPDDAPARCAWMERLGARWGPIFGAVYFVLAVKRTQGARLIGQSWKSAPAVAAAPVSVAGRQGSLKK